MRAPEVERVESRNVRAALAGRIWIIQRIIIGKIIGRQHSESGVAVDPHRALIVAPGFVVGRSRKLVGADVGRGNILEQRFGRRRPRPLRDDRVGEHALRRAAAPRRVVCLARRNAIAQFLGEKIRPILATDGARQLTGQIAKIAAAVGHGGDADQSGIDAVHHSRALIIGEKEHFIAPDRPAERRAELILVELRAT